MSFLPGNIDFQRSQSIPESPNPTATLAGYFLWSEQRNVRTRLGKITPIRNLKESVGRTPAFCAPVGHFLGYAPISLETFNFHAVHAVAPLMARSKRLRNWNESMSSWRAVSFRAAKETPGQGHRKSAEPEAREREL